MKKITSLLLFGLLSLNLSVLAMDGISPVANTPEYDQKFSSEEEFDFTKNTQYLTDEQLKDAEEVDNIDDKAGFWAKIINSSHFSPSTATKTYIPIHKVGK